MHKQNQLELGKWDEDDSPKAPGELKPWGKNALVLDDEDEIEEDIQQTDEGKKGTLKVFGLEVLFLMDKFETKE